MKFVITKDFHNVRLDRFLHKKFQETPMSVIFRLIRKGGIRVNSKRKKLHYRLQENDIVYARIFSDPVAEKPLIHLSSEENSLAARTIAYENDAIILCNKPAGLVMHIGSGHEHGLTEIIQAYTKNPQLSFVHRIDKTTSGLVMAAKNPATARKLSELIREQAIEKYYLAVVEGVIEEDQFTLVSFLKKEHDRVAAHSDASDGAKKASSEFSVLQRGHRRTLLEARLHTGRTHQLRVQLAEIKHPIVGDPKYGRKGGKKMFLFSHRLVVPFYDIDFSLPLPESFSTALDTN